MFFIRSKTNNTIVSIVDLQINVFAGEKFTNIKNFTDISTGIEYRYLCITTKLGTFKINAYDLDHIGPAVEALFNFIYNFRFSENPFKIVDIEDIYDC